MTTITVRRATEADVPAIVPLWKEMMAFHAALDPRFRPDPDGDVHWSRAISAWMQAEDNCVLVAEAEGQIVGYTVGMMRENPPVLLPLYHGFVSDICVAPEWRQRGVGRRMFAALKMWFRQQGADHIELRVAHNNPTSQAFWRKMGCEDYMDSMWCEL
ncbi:MAG: GNAT family N-acetyltransferase [Chloroflexota bacterium]|nr:GNAT family N-acetyltransferase [Chloroflexota bacterium]